MQVNAKLRQECIFNYLSLILKIYSFYAPFVKVEEYRFIFFYIVEQFLVSLINPNHFRNTLHLSSYPKGNEELQVETPSRWWRYAIQCSRCKHQVLKCINYGINDANSPYDICDQPHDAPLEFVSFHSKRKKGMYYAEKGETNSTDLTQLTIILILLMTFT